MNMNFNQDVIKIRKINKCKNMCLGNIKKRNNIKNKQKVYMNLNQDVIKYVILKKVKMSYG